MSTNGTILIADDDRDVVELLKLYIQQLGCRVLIAHDGETALELAQRELPDIVLLDVLMPKKSGWEVCQALKAVHKTSHICVVLITGKGDVRDRLTGLQVGADDYLVKPLDRKEVLERIGKLLKSQSVRAETLSDVPTEPAAKRNPLYDRIAGLPSLPAVLDRAKEILIQDSGLGIIFIDVEQLQEMEEEYGWAFFDEFLRRVGEVITAEIGEQYDDVLVATPLVGGSSFYVFLRPAGSEVGRIEEVSRRLHARLTETLAERFPNLESGQIGFFVGAATIDYLPPIRLERQIYHGMQKATEAVRNAEQARKRELAREL
ncbi:MAG TPA: response regulator, partial [Thermoanaerobaculia bacterium]